MAMMDVHTASDARKRLNAVLARFRADGIAAEPLVFGAQRVPEAVLVPYELFERVLPAIEDAVLAATVRERLADSRPNESFDDVADAVGIDPAEL